MLDFVSRATVVARRASSVHSGFSETALWIQVKFYGKLPTYICYISRPFFFSKFFNFLRTFAIFVVNMGVTTLSQGWCYLKKIMTKADYSNKFIYT